MNCAHFWSGSCFADVDLESNCPRCVEVVQQCIEDAAKRASAVKECGRLLSIVLREMPLQRLLLAKSSLIATYGQCDCKVDLCSRFKRWCGHAFRQRQSRLCASRVQAVVNVSARTEEEAVRANGVCRRWHQRFVALWILISVYGTCTLFYLSLGRLLFL